MSEGREREREREQSQSVCEWVREWERKREREREMKVWVQSIPLATWLPQAAVSSPHLSSNDTYGEAHIHIPHAHAKARFFPARHSPILSATELVAFAFCGWTESCQDQSGTCVDERSRTRTSESVEGDKKSTTRKKRRHWRERIQIISTNYKEQLRAYLFTWFHWTPITAWALDHCICGFFFDVPGAIQFILLLLASSPCIVHWSKKCVILFFFRPFTLNFYPFLASTASFTLFILLTSSCQLLGRWGANFFSSGCWC